MHIMDSDQKLKFYTQAILQVLVARKVNSQIKRFGALLMFQKSVLYMAVLCRQMLKINQVMRRGRDFVNCCRCCMCRKD